jgi:hypothetical protein|tara:strand:+ start:176 stop:364 length:189 start_codon:yes stop_codon:yes gene_type:complete
MRYTYTITDEKGQAETVQAMSWKKMLKSLLLKNAQFTGWISYINKKKRPIVKILEKGKIKHV